MGSVSVLIADDHGVVREGIKASLNDDGGFDVVGEAETGSEVLPLVHRLEPTLVLLAVRLPELDGEACLRLIRSRHPDVTSVMISRDDDEEDVERLLGAGAAAFVHKSIAPEELGPALRLALAGRGSRFPAPRREPAGQGFTQRELTIIRAVARGLPNRAIANELWVTEQTVKFHLTNIYRKLDARNRTEAARAAYRLGVAESPAVVD